MLPTLPSTLEEAKPWVAAAAAASVAAAAAIHLRRRQSKWVRVGTVDELCVYPIKGGVVKSVPVADFGAMGVRAGVYRDRTFGFVKENGESANAKEFARISQLQLKYREGILKLSAPGKDPLAIDPADLKPTKEKEISLKLYDVHVQVMLVGEKYDDYVTDFVTGGSPRLRLVHHHSETPARPPRPVYMKLWPETFLPGDVSTLNDQTPYTLLSWASVHRLNKELPEDKQVTPDWFRSNILIKTDSDEPFQEDEWKGKMKLGSEVVLRYNKPCNRCIAIAIPPASGAADPELEPLRTLRRFRLADPQAGERERRVRRALGESPMFAVNTSLARAGTVRVGDPVYVEK